MRESIGATLRAAREARRLTLAQVAESIRIRPHYLQALESDDLSAMSSAAQARGFLKIYSQFLDVDLGQIVPPPAIPAPASEPESEAPTAPGPEPEAKPTRPNLLRSVRERLGRGGSVTAGPKGELGKTAPHDAGGGEDEPASKKKARR